MNSTDLFVFALCFVVLFFFLFLFVCCLFSFFWREGRVPELLPDLATPGAGKFFLLTFFFNFQCLIQDLSPATNNVLLIPRIMESSTF